jgi:5'-nucleotidase
MKIFLTNDDGFQAPGIQALYRELCRSHEVVMVAPDREKSAVSHGITLHHPVRLHMIAGGDDNGSHGSGGSIGGRIYAVDGTPADCVKLGLAECFSTPPDLLISGINPGSNLGVDINYSGTVAAAREGTLNGIPSLAVSMMAGPVMDYDNLSRFISSLADTLSERGLPQGTFLNINAPDTVFAEIRGVKITCQAFDNLSRCFEKRKDPKERCYFWYGTQHPVPGTPDTDVHAVSKNYLSITPIRCDLTDYRAMAEMPEFSLH